MVFPLNMNISINEYSQMRLALAEDEECVHEVGYLLKMVQRLTQ